MLQKKRTASVALDADIDGSVESQIRRHLATIAASHDAVLSLLEQLAARLFLPDDVVRIIFEFAVGRRERAHDNRAGALLPAQFQLPCDISALRLINKQWARIGGEFVRALHMPDFGGCLPSTLARAFPNTARLSLQRCVIDQYTLDAFSGFIQAFSRRPKHAFYVDIHYCTATTECSVNCHGMLADCERSIWCPNGCTYLGRRNMVSPIRALAFNAEFHAWGPDNIYVQSDHMPDHFASTLSFPVNVCTNVEESFNEQPPPFCGGRFRAVTLRLEGVMSTTAATYMDMWLAPIRWYNGKLPAIKVVVHSEKRRRHVVAFAARLSERHQVPVSVIDDDSFTADADDDEEVN